MLEIVDMAQLTLTARPLVTTAAANCPTAGCPQDNETEMPPRLQEENAAEQQTSFCGSEVQERAENEECERSHDEHEATTDNEDHELEAIEKRVQMQFRKSLIDNNVESLQIDDAPVSPQFSDDDDDENWVDIEESSPTLHKSVRKDKVSLDSYVLK